MKLQLNVNVLIQNVLPWIALNMMSSALEPFKWNKGKKMVDVRACGLTAA